MQLKTFRLCLVAIWPLGGSAARAQPSPAESAIKVVGGQEVQVGVFANTNPSCTGLPAPEIRLLAPPSQGVLAVKLVAIQFGKEAKACAEKRVPALGLFYRANAGVEGGDSVRVEIIAGTASQSKFFTLTLSK